MPSTRKRRVRSDGKPTLSKRPKTLKPQPADDVESRSRELPSTPQSEDGASQEKGDFGQPRHKMKKAIGADGSLLGPPKKGTADIVERKDITGDVNNPDGYHEDVQGETVYHATFSFWETNWLIWLI